jgi:DNA-binding transcriptional ArsR family regulator
MKDLSYKLFFKAFSNKTRFEIINSLRKGPKSVSDIVKKTGLEQSRISHNLKCLIDCGFVENNRNGKKVIYSLNEETIKPLLELIDKHIRKYERHLVKCGIIKMNSVR